MNKKVTNLIFYIIIIFILGLVIMFNTIWGYSNVIGDSMNPNLSNNEHIIYQRNVQRIKRFEIVCIHVKRVFNDKIKNEDIIKRVVGLPYEHVELRKGQLYINNKKIIRNFKILNDSSNYDFGILKKNQIVVLGDNMYVSWDSRFFKAINKKQIFGKVVQKF